ncbi:MAG: 3-deoxy-7-phosphoheptulonate synthase [Fimbriimonadaceae bacterium]
MHHQTADLRIREVRPLIPAAILLEELPLSDGASDVVWQARAEIANSLPGGDRRLVVVVGPCSIHDVAAAEEYAAMLKAEADRLSDDLIVVMRAYFEKPRTTVGWKGLLNDPYLDGSFRVNEGLRIARRFLLSLAELKLPAATEFLDTTVPQHLADLIAWGAIGARTSESQTHRELASGLSMPVGFKNATDGRTQVAIDAVLAARSPHWFPGATKDGLSALLRTAGNEDGHVILRGGTGTGPNFGADHVAAATAALQKLDLPHRLMIDCSHANSGKDHMRQLEVGEAVAQQLEAGGSPIFGVMLESHLVGGRQDHTPGRESVYGQSITDGCLAFAQAAPMLERWAQAVP